MLELEAQASKGIVSRARRVILVSGGFRSVIEKSQVAGGFKSGRSVEIFDQVFKGIIIFLVFFHFPYTFINKS